MADFPPPPAPDVAEPAAYVAVSLDDEAYTDTRGCPAGRYLLQAPYVRALYAAGAVPLLLPHPSPALCGSALAPDAFGAKAAQTVHPGPSEALLALARQALAPAHGLLLTGGDFDVPPAFYGAAGHPRLGRQNWPRSLFERALLEVARARGLPVLGICGGLQLINVVLGGSLTQDLTLRPNTLPHVQPHDRSLPAHPVQVAPDSLLAAALGTDRQANAVHVNSTHHQILERLGTGLRAVAVAPDGVVEAVEATDAAAFFLLAVQWHPEAMRDGRQQGIYHAFVAAIRARMQPINPAAGPACSSQNG